MDTALRPAVPPLPSVVRLPEGQVDVAQDFVTRLRAAAVQFAVAAGAQTAVVREAVPPARHRRARCRVVLRAADGSERDLTFLGPVSRPAVLPDRTFEQQIQQWLAARVGDEGEWLVADDEAPDGVAVDLTAWTGRPAAAGLPTQAMPLQRAQAVPGPAHAPATAAVPAVATPLAG
ncbi:MULTISPECIES: hypothetical protein [unclassified Geodermatophilus]